MASFELKKNWRLYQKRTYHNSHHSGNILKAANVKPPKTSLDAMDIMKLAGGIVGGVLVAVYCFIAVYKKWINEWYNNKIL